MKNPPNYGSVCKLSGKRRNPYMARAAQQTVLEDGTIKIIRPVIGYFATRKDAMQALSSFNLNPYNIAEKATFADIFERWYHEKEMSVSLQSLVTYQAAFKHCELIADRPITSLRLPDYQMVADSVANMSKSTANNVKLVLSGVVEYAMRYEIINHDYTKHVLLKYRSSDPIHHPFSDEEIAGVWAMPKTLERDITLILLYMGWRVTELLNMRSENINTTEWYMTGGNKTAAGRKRIVPIHSRICAIVAEYAEKDIPFSISDSAYRKWLKENTGHLCHDTRHTFVSALQRENADHICIQRLVGHSSDNITDKVYTHKTIEDLRKAIELLKW